MTLEKLVAPIKSVQVARAGFEHMQYYPTEQHTRWEETHAYLPPNTQLPSAAEAVVYLDQQALTYKPQHLHDSVGSRYTHTRTGVIFYERQHSWRGAVITITDNVRTDIAQGTKEAFGWSLPRHTAAKLIGARERATFTVGQENEHSDQSIDEVSHDTIRSVHRALFGYAAIQRIPIRVYLPSEAVLTTMHVDLFYPVRAFIEDGVIGVTAGIAPHIGHAHVLGVQGHVQETAARSGRFNTEVRFIGHADKQAINPAYTKQTYGENQR